MTPPRFVKATLRPRPAPRAFLTETQALKMLGLSIWDLRYLMQTHQLPYWELRIVAINQTRRLLLDQDVRAWKQRQVTR
ncbi:MAG TPA: hypothetical protein VNZ26_12625 [Vicinamibacterales bacterium]|jgi:hypothetical protein|nr:hypothetical protein [Vicinamibacterales bacterium]